MSVDPTLRFGSRVGHYVKTRPGYPREMMDFFHHELGLADGSAVADIGSGTGISTQALLDLGCTVYAVEPNQPMRTAAERALGHHARFHSTPGTAESTGLSAAAVNHIVSMQAFHWFDRRAARREFARILRPGGYVILVWNERRLDTPFLADYEAMMLQYATDYAQVRHERMTDAVLNEFFDPAGFQSRQFDNRQDFDYPSLEGRVLSSSYSPPPGHPQHEAMLQSLQDLFNRHARKGRVAFLYHTKIHYGPFSVRA